MRHLFRFLLSERFRSDDPAAILSGPKRGRGLPKVLSISDVDRLLACKGAGRSAGSLCAASASRHAAVLPARGALRHRPAVSELVTLPLSASRRDARMIVVRGKGNKERLVPLNELRDRRWPTTSPRSQALKPANKKNAGPRKVRCSLDSRERTFDAAASRAT